MLAKCLAAQTVLNSFSENVIDVFQRCRFAMNHMWLEKHKSFGETVYESAAQHLSFGE